MLKNYHFKISQFLNIDPGIVSSIILNPISSETLRNAFEGDAILNYFASLFLLKSYPDEDPNFLTCLRSILVFNKNIAFICENYFFNDLIEIVHLSDHSKCIIFEAILSKVPYMKNFHCCLNIYWIFL